MKVTPEEVVDRLYFRTWKYFGKSCWNCPDPAIVVTGEPGWFGILGFNFPLDAGIILIWQWQVFIHHENDLIDIYQAAREAVRNYDLYVNQMF